MLVSPVMVKRIVAILVGSGVHAYSENVFGNDTQISMTKLLTIISLSIVYSSYYDHDNVLNKTYKEKKVSKLYNKIFNDMNLIWGETISLTFTFDDLG